MVTLRQRTTAATGEPEPKLEEDRLCEDLTILSDDSDDSPSDSTVKHLRERWELASVLNFLNVFGPLVSEKLKLTAEEIEMGLIECNTTNAQLHISLLKDGHDSEDTKKSTADMTAFAQNLLQQMVPDNVGLHHHKEYPYNSFMY